MSDLIERMNTSIRDSASMTLTHEETCFVLMTMQLASAHVQKMKELLETVVTRLPLATDQITGPVLLSVPADWLEQTRKVLDMKS